MSGSWSDWEDNDTLPPRLSLTRVTPITNEEIDRTYNRSLAQQQREISALCLSVAQLEGRLEEAHRRNARQTATIRRLRRRGPRAWEWALAGLVCALERADKRLKHWYGFEGER